MGTVLVLGSSPSSRTPAFMKESPLRTMSVECLFGGPQLSREKYLRKRRLSPDDALLSAAVVAATITTSVSAETMFIKMPNENVDGNHNSCDVQNVHVVSEVIMQSELVPSKEITSDEQIELAALLTDVLHAVHHVMGSHPQSKWSLHAPKLGVVTGSATEHLGAPLNTGPSSPPLEVPYSAVHDALQQVFGADHTTMQQCLEQARERQPPEMVLHLHIMEARELKMMSVDGSSNPYVTASVPGDSHRTRLLHQTRAPRWDQSFTMRVRNIQKDFLRLEVWHENVHLGVGAVRDVKDLRGLGRLMKGTTAPDQQRIGAVVVWLKDIQENGLDGWYPLLKEDFQQSASLSSSSTNLTSSRLSLSQSPASPSSNHTNSYFATSLSHQLAHLKSSGAALIHSSQQGPPHHKQRGEIHFRGTIEPSSRTASNGRRPYDALLLKILMHYISNDEQASTRPLWSGQLPPGALCALHLTGLVEGVNVGLKTLALWAVASRASGVDHVWLVDVLKALLDMDYDKLSEEDASLLQDSLLAWLSRAEDKLATLHDSFPVTRRVTATHQLSGLLRSLRLLADHPRVQSLLKGSLKEGVPDAVLRALERHLKSWWQALLERELRDTVTPEQQVLRVITITDECHDMVAQSLAVYSPVFVSDFGLPYLRIVYLFVTKKLKPCVRPLLMNLYNRLLSSHAASRSKDGKEHLSEDDFKSSYALNAGTTLWQLYVNLGRIHRQGANLPMAVRQESEVKEYHRWFSKGVMHWLQVAQLRTHRIIASAVAADQLVPCDDYCDFSSSATDAITVFIGVRNWWQELAWPDAQNSCVLLGKILEDLCGSSTLYCDLLRAKVDSMYTSHSSQGTVFITKQICIGLNNIERVRDEVARLPEYFRISDLLMLISRTIDGDDSSTRDGEKAAQQFRGTFDRLISSAMENMETKVTEFVDTVVERVTGVLQDGLTAACEAGSPDLLLGNVLDPGLSLMRHALKEANFRRFLTRLWDVLLGLVRTLVLRSAEKKRAPYFQSVHDTLSASLQFFTPSGGLSLEQAMNEEYSSLLTMLSSLRLPTEALVAQYYREREEERKLLSVTSRGELFVTVFFTLGGKLVVEVVMARDMQPEDEVTSITSRQSYLGGGLLNLGGLGPVDPYVKVQLVPFEWFPGALTYSTKVMKKSDPATFQETFTYVLSPDDPNVQDGYLLLTLKDHNLTRSNTFLGEAAVGLASVPLVEGDSILCQPRSLQLRLTRPGMEDGYKSLATLRLRSHNDKEASSFLKKISSRFTDARLTNAIDVRI